MSVDKYLKSIICTLFLVGCGGGSGEDTSSVIDTQDEATQDDATQDEATQDDATQDEAAELIPGGTPSTPTPVSLDSMHEINNNIFNNYFTYSGREGESLTVHASLTIPMSDQQKARCSSNPGAYDTQIILFNSNREQVSLACSEDLKTTLPDDDEYVFHFNFPDNGSGFFDIASTVLDSAIVAPSGQSGSPSNPNPLSLGVNNTITDNTFYNYYRLDVDAGDELIISVSLDDPMSDQQKARCSSNSTAYQTRIIFYDATYQQIHVVCGENATFEFETAGPYIVQFDYASQSSGFFNADVLR